MKKTNTVLSQWKMNGYCAVLPPRAVFYTARKRLLRNAEACVEGCSRSDSVEEPALGGCSAFVPGMLRLVSGRGVDGRSTLKVGEWTGGGCWGRSGVADKNVNLGNFSKNRWVSLSIGEHALKVAAELMPGCSEVVKWLRSLLINIFMRPFSERLLHDRTAFFKK